MRAVDVHQHRWSEPLVAALAARDAPPRLRRRDGGWWLELAQEPPSPIDVAADDVAARVAALDADGVERALVAHSPALGLDALPVDAARRLAAAHAEGCRQLPADRFGWWAALPLADAAPVAVDAALEAGAVGICLPAEALATPAHVTALMPLLRRLEDRDAPLFVHPGAAPSPRGSVGAPGDPAAPSPDRPVGAPGDPAATGPGGAADLPGWWPALGAYVPGMHVAWHAFAAAGRPRLPRLRVLWAMLAGLAPLHAERLAARGGPAAAVADGHAFYDTSSYGALAQRAMVEAVGLAQLVHGSDRPVVAPPPAPGPLGPDAWAALTRANPARLLGPAA